MIRVSTHVLSKTMQLLIKEPLLLLPNLIIKLSVFMFIQMGLISNINTDSFPLKMDGLHFFLSTVPGFFIQPFIILFAWYTLKNKDTTYAKVVQDIRCITPPTLIYWLFVGLLLPLFFIYKIDGDSSNLVIGLSGALLLLITAIVKLITIFFHPCLLIEKNTIHIQRIFKKSIRLFIQYKWVTLWAMVHFNIFMMLGFMVLSSFGQLILDAHYLVIFNECLIAIYNTISSIFLLRLFLLMTPMVNLSDN